LKTLNELYELMGLSNSPIDSSSGFTIVYLQDHFKEFPVSSIPYRPNFFSFLFIKTIAEAKVMLQDKDLSIKEIAGRLGFLEASHFSNYFKKHTSQSPAEYRKQLVQ